MRRMTTTPADTTTKANSVPILVIEPTTPIGANTENADTKAIGSRLQRHGVSIHAKKTPALKRYWNDEWQPAAGHSFWTGC